METVPEEGSRLVALLKWAVKTSWVVVFCLSSKVFTLKGN